LISFKILGQDENDSQQAAEAMIQLGYYNTQQQAQDESLDFDPNYDPSDFLLKKDSDVQPEPVPVTQQYQESYDYSSNIAEGAVADEVQPQYYNTFGHQSFAASDFGFQQPQAMEADYSQSQSQPQQLLMPNDGGGLADLDISDSDDEDDQNEAADATQNPADTSKDDDEGLWF
jgi:hypothetical protein